MSERHTFRATIESAGGGAFVTVPFDVERAFGKKRVQVRATIDGEPYRGSLVRMGGPEHMLIVLKQIRERIGKQAGDEVEVKVEEETEPRRVEVPADLAAALADDPAAAEFFAGLSYTHQREYVLWIEGAKREATRRGRVERAVAMLREGKRAR
jgi:hypothetical protein